MKRPVARDGRWKPGTASTHGLPTGAAAYVFDEATRRREAEERIVEDLRAAGYREAIVPSADYLAPYLPHLSAREERELYRFVDRHGDTLALRADFTVALARHLAPRLAADSGVERVFYRGEVLRGGSQGGAGGEFSQVGGELLGDSSSEADVEIVERCLSALERGGAGEAYLVLSAVGALRRMLSPEATGDAAGGLTAAILDRRLSESDRIARRISPSFAARVRSLLEGDLSPEDLLLDRIEAPGISLRRVAEALASRRECNVAIDVAEPSPRSYYTGFFFTVYGEGGGEPIAGGGRYDELYGAFGAPRPAVGFALGLEGALGNSP